jgi:predicted transcriptional regulator
MKRINVTKTSKQLERHIKGVSNHWRIEILVQVANEEGLSLDEICERVKGNIKTISEHTKKLQTAGLLNKKYHGKSVSHSLSPYGKVFIDFLSSF